MLTAVAQLQTDLAAANVSISTLTSDLATANLTIANNETRVTAVENNTVLELDGYLMLSSLNGYDTAEFTNINVQVNDGSGDTDGIVNGLGNLTIGYNLPQGALFIFCSDPQYQSQTTCEDAGEIYDYDVRRGSHNLIIGDDNSYDDYGSIIVGLGHISNNAYASIIGGYNNHSTGLYSTISGGINNNAKGEGSSISGGGNNYTIQDYSSISGGAGNTTSGYWSSISGGESNTALGDHSSVSGGELGEANSRWSSVTGGYQNTATGENSSVSGGFNREALGIFDWRGGALFEDF